MVDFNTSHRPSTESFGYGNLVIGAAGFLPHFLVQMGIAMLATALFRHFRRSFVKMPSASVLTKSAAPPSSKNSFDGSEPNRMANETGEASQKDAARTSPFEATSMPEQNAKAEHVAMVAIFCPACGYSIGRCKCQANPDVQKSTTTASTDLRMRATQSTDNARPASLPPPLPYGDDGIMVEGNVLVQGEETSSCATKVQLRRRPPTLGVKLFSLLVGALVVGIMYFLSKLGNPPVHPTQSNQTVAPTPIFGNGLTVRLPAGLQFEIPLDWHVLGPDQRKLIEAVSRVGIDRSGQALTEGNQNVFAANSVGMDEYCAVRVDIIKPPLFEPHEISRLTVADLAEASAASKEVLTQEYSRSQFGQRLLEVTGTVVESIGQQQAITTTYRRTSQNGTVVVQLCVFTVKDVSFRLTLSYRESRAAILLPIIVAIKQSVQISR